MSSEAVCLNGRTPEDERQYRIDNRLPLRDVPMTEEEQQQAIAWILERYEETFRILANS